MYSQNLIKSRFGITVYCSKANYMRKKLKKIR